MGVLGKGLKLAWVALLVVGCSAGASSDKSPGDELEGASLEQQAATNDYQDIFSDESVGLSLKLATVNGQTRLKIQTGQEEVSYSYQVLALEEPTKMVIDLPGMTSPEATSLPLENPIISGIEIAANENQSAQLVISFNQNADQSVVNEHELEALGSELMLRLGKEVVEIVPVLEEQTASEEQLAMLDEQNDSQPEIEVIKDSSLGQLPTISEEPQILKLNDLKFNKTKNTAGQVIASLSAEAAFELRQTAPSEYVLNIPGAIADSSTKQPKIAPIGMPGIRSVRATDSETGVEVRMFIDPGVELEALAMAGDVRIRVKPNALHKNARAQLADPEVEASPTPTEEGDSEFLADGITSADGSKIYRGRLISLDLQDTDIDNALRIIAEVSNLNIIASEEVTGKVTLRLIDVPWDQALDVILKTNGLDQVAEGNVIRIAPVEKLRAEREALKEAKRAAEELEDLTVRYIRVSYARVTDLIEQVETVLSERGSVTADERTNQLIVKDIAKGQRDVVSLVQRLDLRTPQVLLETQVVEAQRSLLRDLGFQWNFQYVASPETGNATQYNFPNSVSVGGSAGSGGNIVDFPAVFTDGAGSAISAILESADGARTLTARLSTLETEGLVKVVSRPQVATVNNKEAQIKSVETVRVRLPDSGTSVATGSGASAAGGGGSAFEEIDVGIELRVTPQASPDYFVLLDVYAKSSTFGGREVDNIPSTLEREATSTILVKSGQTFALGGVYRIEDRDQLQGVPFLKDIPVMGHLFRRTLVDKKDEELLFFITPHIVEGSFDPSLM